MDYIVIEIQTFDTGSVTTQAWRYEDELGAEAKYHAVLAAAAKSALPRHAATMLAGDGSYVQHRCYEHSEVE